MRDGSATRRAAVSIQWALTLATLAVIGWVLYRRWDELTGLLDLTPRLFVLISLSAIATYVLNGIELQVLAARFGNRIPLRDTFALGLMVNVLNYLPMKTGTLVNGAVLRGRYGVRVTHFGALVVGSTVVHLWVAATLAGLFLVAIPDQAALGIALLAAPTAVVAALMAWGRFARPERDVAHLNVVLRFAYKAVQGMADIFGHGRLMATELVINAALIGLWSLRTYWALEALSTNATLAQSVVVSSFAIVLSRLSVIPGGLGFREGGAAAAAGAVGLTSTLGLASAVIDRAVNLVWLVIFGIPATLYVSRMTGHTLGEWLDRARAERAARAGSEA